jgi:hypothetical protein
LEKRHLTQPISRAGPQQPISYLGRSTSDDDWCNEAQSSSFCLAAVINARAERHGLTPTVPLVASAACIVCGTIELLFPIGWAVA